MIICLSKFLINNNKRERLFIIICGACNNDHHNYLNNAYVLSVSLYSCSFLYSNSSCLYSCYAFLYSSPCSFLSSPCLFSSCVCYYDATKSDGVCYAWSYVMDSVYISTVIPHSLLLRLHYPRKPLLD